MHTTLEFQNIYRTYNYFYLKAIAFRKQFICCIYYTTKTQHAIENNKVTIFANIELYTYNTLLTNIIIRVFLQYNSHISDKIITIIVT